VTTSPASSGQQPPTAPEPVSRAEREAFASLVADSLPAVRASAQSWRNGLTALITLVATGIVIKGRDTTAGLSTGWRLAITLSIGAGLAVAAWGLWHALAAEAGTHTRLKTLADIHDQHASVAAYQVALASIAGRRLQTARNAVALSLALLLTGVFLTWWAPAPPASSSPHPKVAHLAGQTTLRHSPIRR
jgi:hypothetical protein